MVINVEAKADEPFGDLIGEYLDQKVGSGLERACANSQYR